MRLDAHITRWDMTLLFVKATILVSSVLLVVIPAAIHRREATHKVARNYKGRLERTLLGLVSVAFSLGLIWIAAPVFAFAEYPLRPIHVIAGVACLLLGLLLLYRSHKDLGPNWSITLELREQHRLITRGIYRHVRHPMYLALLLYALGQALLVPNWIGGPSYLVAVMLLVALRLRPEERMLMEEFPNDFATYSANTKCLIPWIW